MEENVVTLGNKNYIKDEETCEYTRYNPLLDVRIKYLKKQLKQAKLVRILSICIFSIFILVSIIKGNYFIATLSFLYMMIILVLSANYIKSLSYDLRHEQNKITKFKVIK